MAVHLEEMRVSGVREAARRVNHPLNMEMTQEGSSLFCANKDLSWEELIELHTACSPQKVDSGRGWGWGVGGDKDTCCAASSS